jgi:predicted nucleotidyltransferase
MHALQLKFLFHISQILSAMDYAQLKRLPPEIKFDYGVKGVLKNDPLLKHLETIGGSRKYVLQNVERFGSMLIFFEQRLRRPTLTVLLVD